MELIKQLTVLERTIIPELKDGISHRELAKKTDLQEVETMRALQWLSNKGVLNIKKEITKTLELDEKGKEAHKKGLPELNIYSEAKKKAGTLPELAKRAGVNPQAAGAAMGILKREGNISLEKGNILAKKEPNQETKKLLDEIAKEPQEEQDKHKELIRRRLVKVNEKRDNLVELTTTGKKLVKTDLGEAPEERITAQDLKTGAWKNKEYRNYDVTLNVPMKSYGKKHFVNEAIEYIKRVWIELGFQEMQGDMAQSALWDLDALFVPQDHPAREMQDTFYLEESKAESDKELFKKVKAAHEDGGDTGSTGWQYKFSKEESEQILLRTHTTALSAQTLKQIHEGKKPIPGKYFAVGPVFRNEDLDWKHLFEFHQVEGIVVEKGANFRHLLGYLELFFKKLGYEKVRIRPAHFPYTEPSAEVDGWHPIKKQWVELGGAGLFRPEVTKTLLGEDISVLAWGLGMERSITEYYGITDLRELYGNDLKQLQTMKKWMK